MSSLPWRENRSPRWPISFRVLQSFEIGKPINLQVRRGDDAAGGGGHDDHGCISFKNQPDCRKVTRPMREIDGRWLYYMFLAGTRKVVANQERLNRINVFPVKDGDTGAVWATTETFIQLLQ
jgi:hypothetical protein